VFAVASHRAWYPHRYQNRFFASEGGRKCFWELNTDLEATVEVLGSIDRRDGVVELVD